MLIGFVFALILTKSTGQDTCNVGDLNARVDCHTEPGATQDRCTAKGCCWDQVQLGIPWCYKPASKSTSACSTPDIARGDCHPERGASQDACVARGCCWRSSSASGASWCYFPNDYKGYSLENQQETNFGSTASLKRVVSSVSLPYPKMLSDLKMEVRQETENRLRLKIYDPNSQRYEVPLDTPKVSTKAATTVYDYSVKTSPFAGLQVTRKSSSSIVFDTSVGPLTYSDQYIEITVAVPTAYLYGLGEHTGPLLLTSQNGTKFTMWSRDQPPNPDRNLYGAHPFLLGMESDGNAFGIFLLNSNAMEVGLVNTNPISLNYKTSGGILDFYIFLGPTPDNVIQQYTEVIGRPMLPPYWSLGFHLCRWGYTNTDNLRQIILDMRKTQIPYDTQWADIDYMDKYKDWTLDPVNFAGLPTIVDELHNFGMHFVPIVDPAISNSPGYAPYDDGVNRGVFIKAKDNSTLIVGKVWPGDTVYPDFTHPAAVDYWYTHAKGFYDQVKFDGMWIDMNEPSNFVTGSLSGCGVDSIDNPPFVPPITGNINDKTLCTSAQQYLSSHYNLHSMYGHFEAKVTFETMKRIRNKRSLIISRSTYSGSGKYTGHWTGDNYSSWADMKYSISGILSFNMFGIPMVGADICGYAGTVDPELCTRWMQLGSFYPFMRNHRDNSGDGQDPASAIFKNVLPYMRSAVQQRYRLLPYLYTLLYHSHISGDPVVRPLFFQFPQDSKTFSIDEQFLWGDGLLISPVLTRGATTVQAYLPLGNWYDLVDGAEMMGGTHVLDAPLSKINVHVRGGVIIPTQEHDVTTTKSRTKDFTLIVALSQIGYAKGDLFWDDGESFGTEFANSNYLTFTAENAHMTSTIVRGDFGGKITLGSIVMYGVHARPSTVYFNNHQISSSYNSTNKVLTIEHLNWNLLRPFTFNW